MRTRFSKNQNQRVHAFCAWVKRNKLISILLCIARFMIYYNDVSLIFMRHPGTMHFFLFFATLLTSAVGSSLSIDKSFLRHRTLELTSNKCCGGKGVSFPNTDQLKSAVDLYFTDKHEATTSYGEMNCWDISDVTDLSYTFYYEADFNENIACWDVSNVTNMQAMFAGATSFNQPIDGWSVAKVNNAAGTFFGAAKFNQNLCSWHSKIGGKNIKVGGMLKSSACDDTSDPDFDRKESFCQECSWPSASPTQVRKYPYQLAPMSQVMQSDALKSNRFLS